MADAAPADALFGDAGDDLFGAVADTNAASGLFDADPQEQKPVHDVSGDLAGVFGAPGDVASDPFANVGNGDGGADGGVNSVLEDYANQGWYDDDGKFHLYEDPAESYVAPAATTANTTQTQAKTYTPNAYAPTSYTPQTTQSSYGQPAGGSPYAPPPPTNSASGPYAPPATNAYTPATNKYAPPPTNAYAPPTNTYTPPTNAYTPSMNAYAPSANSYTPSTNTYTPSMNSYTPSTNAYAPPPKPYAPPPPSTNSYFPPPPTAYTSPAPPAPSGNEHLKYRSPSANAYDPPIPAARRRIDSSASSVSAGSPSLAGPFGQTTFSPAQPAYGQIGHGAPPAPPSGPPQGRGSRAGSQGSVLSGGVPQRTLSPADALAPGRVGSPLAGPGRVGSPLVKTVSPYDPPAPVAGSTTVSPTAGPGAGAHPPPAAPPKQAYGLPPATGTKSSFDPPPPRTGTKSSFDPPLTGRKNAFDPPLTGRKSAFDPPLTGRKNAFDPPPPRTGTKSAFNPPPPRAGPSPMQRQASQPHHGAPPPMTPNLGGTPSGFAPPPRPKSAYDPPPARPASGASGRYIPGLDMSSTNATAGPRSAPGESRSSVEMDGRGSLDGADSGYKSRTSMSSERAWMDEADDPEGGSGPPRIEETSDDPEGGMNDDADRTLVAPMLGVNGPKIMATAPTPIASPGHRNAEFGDDPEGGEAPYVPRTASPAVMSRTASPAVPPPPRTASPAVSATASPVVPPASAGRMSRTTSVSSTGDSPYGHKVSPSLSKRPAPVVVEPPQATNKYTIDTQPYTPMYGASPYSDVQTSPPKKQTSADPYAPTSKPVDPYAPTNKPATDPYAPTNKPTADPYAPPKAAEPHQPSKFTGEPTQRVTYSPPNGLARVYTPPPTRNGALGSRQSSMASVTDAYAPSKDPYAPPAPAKDPYAPPSKDPYAPPTNVDPYAPSRTAPRDIKRPASTAYDPPMPAVPQQPHAASYTPGVPSQMYAPRRDSRTQDQGDVSDYEGSSGYISRYNYSSVDPYQPSGTPAAYVPTPSGTDPLGRHDSRAPIIAFGFGGRVITSFPGLSELTGGFDVSLGRKAAPIQVRTLHKIIPESAVENSTAVFPGPLFSDPGSPTKSLVSVTTGGSGAKTKKAAVIKYLGERAEEIERGLGYLAVESGAMPGPSERSKAEGKLVLVLLLKIMVEHDGKLSGTPVIDAAVRQALVPRLASTPAIASPNSQAASFTLASALDVTAGPLSSQSNPSDSPVATYKVKPVALDKIQEFLLQGERRAAYHYALDERMWAHAMLISSSLDKEAWKEVVNEFIRSELGVRTDQKKPAPFGGDPSVANGREPLRVAYSLFAGQGAAAVQELLPPKNLAKTGADSLMPPGMQMMHATPISPNFPQPVLTSNVPTPALLQWQEIAATILANQGDSLALTALGDYLISNKWTEAAHVCYLLSPATSPVGGLSTPSVRMVLLGSESPAVSRNFEKDDDAIIFTEIAEYAHSLLPTVKGQEAYAGIPHLQAYKLIRAARLTEMGHLSLATRYCEAISTSTQVFGRPSPFFTPCFAAQCKELSDRLSGVPQLDGSGSWISKRGPKQSLGSVGGWITGGLTKLIAGDEEPTSPPTDQGPKAESGAFSHYSAISSANTSQTPSPNASVIGLPPTQPGIPPPRRSGSAMAQRPGSAAALRNGMHHPTDRSASAMDYLRPPANKSSPSVPAQAFSASAATTTFYQADIGYRAGVQEPSKMSAVEEDSSPGPSTGATYTSWWGGADESSGPTPTATTFFQVDSAPEGGNADDGEGFVSLMDTFSPMPSPAPGATSSFRSTPHHVEDEDDEDLGFGNSKKPKKEEKTDDESDKDKGKEKEKAEEKKKEEEPKKDPKEAAKAPELKPTSSWIGRWWSRKDSDSPAPVKANLGDQMSLVYDKELKRWINPNAPKPEPAAATPPPPSRTPSRTQTSSPGPSPGPGPSPLGRTSADSAPPSRPQSAGGLAPPPPPGGNGPRRVRSTLNESFGPGGDISSSNEGSRTSTPPMSMRGPPSRGQTPAGKRNIRSRYVDVFAEPPPSPST